jgi:cytochrome c-type biogenesis protein CcmH/NrfG
MLPPRVFRSRAIRVVAIAVILGVIVVAVRAPVMDRYTSWRAAKMSDDVLAVAAGQSDAPYEYVAAWGQRLDAHARYAEAERVYVRAMELRPTDPDTWSGYGRSAFAAGDWAKAEAELRKTLDQWPDKSDARFVLAALLASTFRLHSAIDQMQAGLRLDPGNGQAWMSLGELEMRVGDATAAVNAYSKAQALEPNAQKLHSYYGAALLTAGKYSQAQAELEIALKEDPSSSNARFDMGKALAYGGKPQDRPRAMQELNRVVKFSANKSRAYMEAGRIWLRDGERGNAIQDFEQAYQLNQTNIDMLTLLMKAYTDDGRRADAARISGVLARAQKLTDERGAILSALDAGKDVVSGLIHLGRVDRDLDNNVEAGIAFEAARRLDPENQEVARELMVKPPKARL